METQTSETIDPTLAAEASHYEALRRQHISDLLARMPENVKRVKWPVERVREERQRRLRSLIRVAKEKSPWHGERLGNVDSNSITEADRKSTRLNSSHVSISYAVFCLKK